MKHNIPKDDQSRILEYTQLGLLGIEDRYKVSTLTEKDRLRMAKIRDLLGMDHREIVAHGATILLKG